MQEVESYLHTDCISHINNMILSFPVDSENNSPSRHYSYLSLIILSVTHLPIYYMITFILTVAHVTGQHNHV